jgi:glycosyltransferase involved in cell wall biosynthesis
VQNKIYEGLAMRRPVLTGDSPTVRATLTHRRHAYLVPRGEPGILAEAILDLKGDPALRDRLAREGYQLYQSQFTPTALGKRMLGHLYEVLDR